MINALCCAGRFGKHIDNVVPFLPLGKPQMRAILDLKLKEMDEEHRQVVL
jgi:ATP-dependent Clp protease ATP-binding subunit ClpA